MLPFPLLQKSATVVLRLRFTGVAASRPAWRVLKGQLSDGRMLHIYRLQRLDPLGGY